MIRNYLKTAWRNLWKNKVFSIINILGLVLGLVCSLLIMFWVNSEYKMDAFHKNNSQLYRVFERRYSEGQPGGGAATQGLMPDEMKRVFPEVQYATGYAWNSLSTFSANNKIIKENGNHAGQDFLKMFTYTLLEGDPITALQSPVGIVISRKMAEDFFGSPKEAIGKTILYENKKNLEITAVFDNVPESSSAKFDYLINWQTFLENNEWAKDWTNNAPQTYLMLRKGTDVKSFEKKIARFLDTYNKEQTPDYYIRLGIQRYSDIYLHSNFKNGEVSGGRIQYVRLFSIVAIFILLIACINFMNLTTARSVKRAKEIGVRKVVGAVRYALIRQFISEALIVVSIALVISVAVVILVLPLFNKLTGKEILIPLKDSTFWLGITGLLFVTGFISGSYPALHLSSLKPIRILRGSLKFSNQSLWFRKGLVVFQFMLSVVFIIGAIVVRKQVHYIQSINLGYNKENLLYVPLEGDLASKYELFKDKALKMQGIKNVSRITDVPTKINNGTSGIQWEGKDPNSKTEFTHTAVGYDFVTTMRAQVAQGRDFSKDFGSDSVDYLINETGVKTIGYKDPIGKPLTLWGKKGTIIGVVKDFHFNSLHEPINPLVLRLGENIEWGTALVRTEPGKTQQTLASLEKICKELNPRFPFTYKFSDEEYQNLYESEQVVNKLANYFAFLAIFISCLGLLGLAIFTSEQRTKEFGIRKVLGASPVTLFKLLSKEFLVLVLIAMVIAFPLAWIVMNAWLQDYFYRIQISWWMFGVTGAAALFIALTTVSFQAIKAAIANPIKSLRTE